MAPNGAKLVNQAQHDYCALMFEKTRNSFLYGVIHNAYLSENGGGI